MRRYRAIGSLALLLVLTACELGTATFVTSTDIGISADAKAENLHLGYVRTELFVGPDYPDQGEAPQIVGFLSTNLSAFSPKIKQLYATGDAAGLVTQIPAPTQDAEKPGPYTGERRAMIFGTGTNLGLKIGFTGNAPSSIKFGFNREEASIIPLHQATPTSAVPDKYASVLAAINMDQTASTLANTSVQLTQFFATGSAARNLARRTEIRSLFAQEATAQVQQTTLDSWNKTTTDDTAAIKTYLEKGGSYTTAKRDALLQAANVQGYAPADLKSATTEADFLAALNKHTTFVHPLAVAVQK